MDLTSGGRRDYLRILLLRPLLTTDQLKCMARHILSTLITVSQADVILLSSLNLNKYMYGLIGFLCIPIDPQSKI